MTYEEVYKDLITHNYDDFVKLAKSYDFGGICTAKIDVLPAGKIVTASDVDTLDKCLKEMCDKIHGFDAIMLQEMVKLSQGVHNFSWGDLTTGIQNVGNTVNAGVNAVSQVSTAAQNAGIIKQGTFGIQQAPAPTPMPPLPKASKSLANPLPIVSPSTTPTKILGMTPTVAYAVIGGVVVIGILLLFKFGKK
jgi:hypothetical protein